MRGTARIEIVVTEDSDEFIAELSKWLRDNISKYTINALTSDMEILIAMEYDKEYLIMVDGV